MKTRTLLLLALGCGVAIMLAGAVFFVQLATRDDIADPVQVGTPAEVGDVSATVVDAEEADGVLTVHVTLDAPDGIDASTGFHLIASGRPVEPETVACSSMCTVTFDVTAADGDSRVLFYVRGDDQARWELA